VTTTIRPESFDSDIAQQLNLQVQAEYTRRYGGGDETVIVAADFTAPNGGYFIAVTEAGVAVASGAWRAHGESDAEMKRLYVIDAARGQGLARMMVAHLEADAAAAGRTRMILETGDGQPEALNLYDSLGYRPVEPFGFYAGEEGARHLGKPLPVLAEDLRSEQALA
jgi:GNAT superfamily N-acetyltransferase